MMFKQVQFAQKESQVSEKAPALRAPPLLKSPIINITFDKTLGHRYFSCAAPSVFRAGGWGCKYQVSEKAPALWCLDLDAELAFCAGCQALILYQRFMLSVFTYFIIIINL